MLKKMSCAFFLCILLLSCTFAQSPSLSSGFVTLVVKVRGDKNVKDLDLPIPFMSNSFQQDKPILNRGDNTVARLNITVPFRLGKNSGEFKTGRESQDRMATSGLKESGVLVVIGRVPNIKAHFCNHAVGPM